MATKLVKVHDIDDECFSYPSNAGVYFMLCEEDEDEWLAK